MTKERACERCIYWHRMQGHMQDYLGQCRRYAPREIDHSSTPLLTARWPRTVNSEWCGEYVEKKGTEE